MGKRSTARRLAMQCMYQYEIKGGPVEDIIVDTITSEEYIEETKELAMNLVKVSFDNIDSSDDYIKKNVIDWSFDRMAPVDKSILRLAIAEMVNTETPNSVVIDEAVSLAKKYSTDDSIGFVNGVLGKINKILSKE